MVITNKQAQSILFQDEQFIEHPFTELASSITDQLTLKNTSISIPDILEFQKSIKINGISESEICSILEAHSTHYITDNIEKLVFEELECLIRNMFIHH